MKKLRKFIRSISYDNVLVFLNNILKKITLNIRICLIFIISLSWIFLYKLLFINIPNIFTKASQIAEITFNLLSSIIASCIFYFFVVYLEQRRIKKELYPVINRRIATFTVGLYLIKKDLYNLKGQKIPDKIPDYDIFIPLCEGIDLYSKPPEIIGNPSFNPSDWFEYFNYYFQADNALLDIIYRYVTYLSPALLKELNEINYSQFQRALDVYRINKRYNLLSGTAGPLWHYLKTLEKIGSLTLK